MTRLTVTFTWCSFLEIGEVHCESESVQHKPHPVWKLVPSSAHEHLVICKGISGCYLWSGTIRTIYWLAASMAFKRQPLQTQVLRTPWDPIWLWQYRGPFQEHRQHGMGLSGLELQYSQFGDVSWALSWLTKDTPTAFNSMIFQLLGSSPTYMIQTKAAAIFSRTIHPAFLLQQGAAMMNPRAPRMTPSSKYETLWSWDWWPGGPRPDWNPTADTNWSRWTSGFEEKLGSPFSLVKSYVFSPLNPHDLLWWQSPTLNFWSGSILMSWICWFGPPQK